MKAKLEKLVKALNGMEYFSFSDNLYGGISHTEDGTELYYFTYDGVFNIYINKDMSFHSSDLIRYGEWFELEPQYKRDAQLISNYLHYSIGELA